MPEQPTIRQEVHRPAASLTLTHTHKWGVQFGDSTDLRVTRTSGGGLNLLRQRQDRDRRGAGRCAGRAAAAGWSDDRG